jgi:hypothetical protein
MNDISRKKSLNILSQNHFLNNSRVNGNGPINFKYFQANEDGKYNILNFLKCNRPVH